MTVDVEGQDGVHVPRDQVTSTITVVYVVLSTFAMITDAILKGEMVVLVPYKKEHVEVCPLPSPESNRCNPTEIPPVDVRSNFARANCKRTTDTSGRVRDAE